MGRSENVLGTMIVIEHRSGAGEHAAEHLPDPLRAVGHQRHPHLLQWKTIADHNQGALETLRILDLVPAGEIDDAAVFADEIQPAAFDLAEQPRAALVFSPAFT